MDHTYVIVRHGCRQWVNHLWSDMSIHAAALETKSRVINFTWFEHNKSFWPLHGIFALIFGRVVRGRCGIWSPLAQIRNLAPTEPLEERCNTCRFLFFFGWLFRNPTGFEKYRTELLNRFGPTKKQRKMIESRLTQHVGKQLIGVYVRHKPFRFFDDGEFLISQKRTAAIVEEYLREQNLDHSTVAIIETSDQDDEQTTFHLLSRCSVIIGTNSTYCNLAAWFGNIPHIVTFNESIDWEYYRNKENYFENKYATFAYGGRL